MLPKLPRGMGTYDYKNGKVRFRKSVNFNGVSKLLSVTGSSVNEVNKLMTQKEKEFIRQYKLNQLLSQTKTLEQGMKEWLELYKSEELNSKSYDRIESTFLNHVYGSDLGRTQESKINTDSIQKHIRERKNVKTGEPLSYSSQKKLYELLNQYFKYRYATEPYLNPMIGVSKPKNKSERLNEDLIIWNDDEMDALTKTAYEPYIAGKSGFKHGLAIVFLMWSFMRVGELLGLQWKDIDLEKKTVDIHKQLSRVRDREHDGFKPILTTTKYKSSRKIILTNMAYDAIAEYKKRIKPQEDDFVINCQGKPVAMNTITNTYKAMIKASGLPDKHVTIHGLRHSGISYLLRHGVPVEVVSKMAGHRSIQITLDTYYSVLEEQKSNAIEEFNEKQKKGRP